MRRQSASASVREPARGVQKREKREQEQGHEHNNANSNRNSNSNKEKARSAEKIELGGWVGRKYTVFEQGKGEEVLALRRELAERQEEHKHALARQVHAPCGSNPLC
eukprot:129614-Rhodomonas_salina.2